MVQDASYLKECYPTLGGETPCQRIGGTRLLRFLALLVHKGRAKQQELRAARYAPIAHPRDLSTHFVMAFGLSLTTLSAGLALSHCQSYRMTAFECVPPGLSRGGEREGQICRDPDMIGCRRH